MKTKIISVCAKLVVFIAVIICVQNVCFAQGGNNYYNFGSQPALSPWLSLGNKPTGVLDSYNQYVRPQLQVRDAFAQQQAQLNRQGNMQRAMESQIISGGTAAMPKTTGRSKQAATFRNYSHYYPNAGR
ncbi:MAG: hypothetical protein ACRC2T_16465 [Thermoguttaceae bacterium]